MVTPEQIARVRTAAEELIHRFVASVEGEGYDFQDNDAAQELRAAIDALGTAEEGT